MVTEQDNAIIKETVTNFDLLKDVDVSGKEGPDCVISFTTTFAGDSAFDLELSKGSSGFQAVLLSSSETPLMQNQIDTINKDQIDLLFDHVVETIRELEGN